MKSTKKSLFITTIAMVVLMVVALSTATFAWYTSSSEVSAVSTQISTATSSEANIAIGWNPDATGKSVEFKDSGLLVPMVPTTAFEVNTTTAADAAALMKTGTLVVTDAGAVFSNNGATTDPWTQIENKADGASTTLYLSNWNTLEDVTVNITMGTPAKVDLNTDGDDDPATNPSPDITGIFHLAVFAKEAGKSDPVFKGLLGAATANYGYIVKDKAGLYETAEEGAAQQTATMSASTVSITIPKAIGSDAGDVQIALVGWIDGVGLNNALAGGALTFDLTIAAQ